MRKTTPSIKTPAPSTLHYVAIGQTAPGGAAESLNTFDKVDDAARCAGEFVAGHLHGCAAWVETIEVKPVTKESKP